MRRNLFFSAALLLSACSFAQTENAPGPGSRPVWYSDRNSITATVGFGGSAPGIGFGLGYERILDQRGRFSLHTPLAFSRSQEPFRGAPAFGRFRRYDAIYAAPGVRYHPLGAAHKVDLSIGGRMAFGPLRTLERDAGFPMSTESTSYTSFLAAQAELAVAFRGGRNSTLFGAYLVAGPTLAGDFGSDGSGTPLHPGMLEAGIRMGGSF